MEPNKFSEAICYSRTFRALLRGQRGPWEAGAGSLYHRKPLPAQASCFKHVFSLHLLPASPKPVREGASCGQWEPALLVLAGLSFTAQVLPPFAVEACVPKASRSHREETGRRLAALSACTPSGKGENRSAQSTWEEARANTQQAAPLSALATAQPRHGLLHPHASLCKLPLHKGPRLPSTSTKHAQLHLHQVEHFCFPAPQHASSGPASPPLPPRDTHSLSTAERFPSITLTKSWYEMVSLTPPVTSEIIFFSSRWVFGAPIFSIILLTDIKSARTRQLVLSRSDHTEHRPTLGIQR